MCLLQVGRVQADDSSSSHGRGLSPIELKAALLATPPFQRALHSNPFTAHSFEPWQSKVALFGQSHHGLAGFVPLITDTWFNSVAIRHLRAHGALHETVSKSVPSLPAGAEVMLLAWWPIAAEGASPVPLWSPGNRQGIGRSNGYLNWPTVASVRTPQSANCNTDADLAAGCVSHTLAFAGRYRRIAQQVDLSDFVTQRVSQSQAIALEQRPAAAKLARMVLGRAIRAGDWLALVALHLVQGDGGNGVWATAWWRASPLAAPLDDAGDDSPNTALSNIPAVPTLGMFGALAHYAFDGTSHPLQPLEPDGTANRCFNPWLEGGLIAGSQGGGEDSNCLACHLRAGIPATDFLTVTRGLPQARPERATAALWSPALNQP